MQTSESISDLAGALAKAQGAFPAIERNRTVTVQPRDQGKRSYTFTYATLDAIVEGVRKPLSENGLAYVQALVSEEGGMMCETTLLHSSGQWLRTLLPVKFSDANNSAQALGSAITYAKRYSLTAMLGIVADEDDDANITDGNQVQASQYKQRAPKPTPTPEIERQPDEPAERTMTKEQARPEYDVLVKEIHAIQDSNALAMWGKKNKARLDQMPADWQISLKNEYADHKATLMQRAAQ